MWCCVLPKRSRSRVKDKWRLKKWYSVMAPKYFGGVQIGYIPGDEQEHVKGRIIESTLYDLTEDFAYQHLKMYFQIIGLEGKQAVTLFKGHEYSRDYLRSLVRRRTTRVDGVFSVITKDKFRLRVSACVFTLTRIRTSQEKSIRSLMKRIIVDKADSLNFEQFVHEAVLGKIASDVYNEAKKIAPLRHVGIRKSVLIGKPPEESEISVENS
jgi:small subunit ribosomal protein S3Ae